MAYVTTGAEGSVVSLGSANFYSVLLSKFTPMSAVVSVESDDVDVTGLDVESAVKIAGLYSWSVELSGSAFSPPRLGNVGSLAFSDSTYDLHVRAWEWNAQALEIDITEMAGPPIGTTVSKAWRPDGPLQISGTFESMVDSATALSNVAFPGTPASLPTLTLVYGDDATDDQLSGAAIVRQLTASVAKGQLNTANYGFNGSGAWTPAGTNSPFGSSALGIPLWSAGGSAAGAIVIATLTGSKTISGADSFWTRLRLRCAVGGQVEMSATLRGTGALTFA